MKITLMIPVLSLPNYDESPTGLMDAGKELDSGLKNNGFIYIGNHGINQSIINAAFAASKDFHQQPLANKQLISINEFHRGYMPLASSLIVTSSVERATQPNLSESLMIMHDVPSTDTNSYPANPVTGANQWPANLPGFQKDVMECNLAMEKLSRFLLVLIELALGLEATSISNFFNFPTTFLRLLHYPAMNPPAPENSYGSAPHTDYGFITLLAQDNTGGLQVDHPQKGWIEAPPIDNCLIMNIGDIAETWSNGRWCSTRHRVISPVNMDRYSIPFFFDPEFNTVVQPLLPAEKPSKNVYQSIHYGDYLMYRLNKNYSYRHDKTVN